MVNNIKSQILADERAAAFKAVYLKEVDVRTFSKKFPVVAKTKKAVFSLVEGNLPAGLTGQALERACHELAGAKAPVRCWSDDELRDAIVSYQFKAVEGVLVDSITKEFGVSRTTLWRHRQRLRAAAVKAGVSMEQPKERWLQVAKAIDFPTGGRPTLFTPDEERILLELCALHADRGAGKTQRLQAAFCQKAAAVMAQKEPPGKEQQRLAKASLGRGWLAAAKTRQGGGDIWKELKPSLLSQTRAMAKKPEQNAAMFSSIQAMFDAAGAKGQLRGCQRADGHFVAPPHLILCGDEMGIEPNGKTWAKVLTRKGLGGDKVHRIVTGEHNPFWVTLFFWSCADGTLPVPPMVIHKAKAMRGDLAHGLPVVPGKEWLVRATESGCAARSHPNQRQSHRPPPAASHAHAVPARG